LVAARKRIRNDAALLGEVARWVVSLLGFGDPGNPFAEREPMSDAMRAHLAGWERDLWRGMVDASRER
jgi:hypothetical protein